MIALLSSYLFDQEALLLDSIYWSDEHLTQQYWTLPYVPGKRYGDKPVYVLTSTVTFSGGEMFAYDLQAHKRATIIGDKTDGGAHAGASYRLNAHLEVFIPIGRPVNPVNGTNWEGAGVTPDISVPQEQAFTAAYHMALRASLVNLGASPSGLFEALAKEIRAALENIKNCAEALDAVAVVGGKTAHE
jgi:hypothetical protein